MEKIEIFFKFVNRHIFLLLCLILSSFFSNAQDIIVLRNADEIQVKVKEITPTTISYVKWNNLDGPNYTINKSEVFFIKYENGEKEIFDNKSASKNQGLTENLNSTNNKNTSSKIKFNPTPSSKFIAGFVIGYISQQWKYGNYYKIGLIDGYSSSTPTLEFGLEFLPDFKYGIGFRTGLLIDMGFKAGTDYVLYECNIPLHLSYRYEFFKDFSLFFRMGPTFNFRIGYYSIEEDDGIFYPEEEVSYFDCLWAVTGGIRYKRFQVSIGGEFGLNKYLIDWDYYLKLKKPIVLSLSILLGKRQTN